MIIWACLGEYRVIVPSERLENDFDAVMSDILPGAAFNNQDGHLLSAILARSVVGHEHRMPTYSTEAWMTEEGWFFRGKLISGPVEIAHILKVPDGAEKYLLRVPRQDAAGYDFCKIDWDQLNAGTFESSVRRDLRISDPIQLSMELRRRYESLSEAGKQALATETVEQMQREHRESLFRQFRLPQV
jgi:hypothetical protein